MPRSSHTAARPHFVVDGSNIATEGRSSPSLQQLNEAVLAFIDEHPDALITVVADATFGHRIDSRESKAFDEAVANNEIVTPPAGAVGRGDAFVLTIAHKAKASILSNDSFQEFHGDYPWLFDSGRLIGGKPVPHVGWVFVERLPVRGPKSRQSVRAAKTGGTSRRKATELASLPLPVPTAPPPGPAASERAAEPRPAGEQAGKQSNGVKVVNELMPFLDFVERHPVGTSCTVVVESYTSHGAYARAGDVLVYLPLRLMGSPVPRSARAAVSIGEAVAVVIAGYVPERRSIDAALPSAVGTADVAVAPVPETPTGKSTRRRRPVASAAEAPEPAPDDQPESGARRRRAKRVEAVEVAATGRRSSKKAAAPNAPEAAAAAPKPAKRSSKRSADAPPSVEAPPVKRAAAKRASDKPAAAKSAAAKSAATKPAAAPTPAKRSAAKRSVTKPSATATPKATPRRTSAARPGDG